MASDVVSITIVLIETAVGFCPHHPDCRVQKRVHAVINGVPTDHTDTCAMCFDHGDARGAQMPPGTVFSTFLMSQGGEPPKLGPAPPSRATKRRSRRQENDVADDLGGQRQKASGALPGAKGDVRLKGKARVECKMTTAKSYRLQLEDLSKIRGEAAYPEIPAFVISFLEPHTNRERDRWAVVPWTWAVTKLKE